MYWRLAADGGQWPSMQSRYACHLDILHYCACEPCITVAEEGTSHLTIKGVQACLAVAMLCEALWGRAFISQDSRTALQRTGCSWTGLTVSKQQLEEGVARVKAAGLSDSIRLLFCDYREGQALGQFDKVRSPCWLAHPFH